MIENVFLKTILVLIGAIIETYIIELPVMILAFDKEYKKRYIALIVLCVNALTNIILNGIIIPGVDFLGYSYLIDSFILFFEVIIVVIEAIIYCSVFGVKISKSKIWLVTIYANIISFIIGQCFSYIF